MNGTRNSSDLGQELRLVPWWSYFLGGIAFLCLQFVFHVVIPRHPNPPPEGVRLFLGTLTGLAMGAYFMLLGYVNVDSGRRGMSRTVWTLVVLFIPNGIGYIIYFLMRKPLAVGCLQCGTPNEPSATFCHKCGNRLKPVCSKCGAALNHVDAFCTACGTPVTAKP